MVVTMKFHFILKFLGRESTFIGRCWSEISRFWCNRYECYPTAQWLNFDYSVLSLSVFIFLEILFLSLFLVLLLFPFPCRPINGFYGQEEDQGWNSILDVTRGKHRFLSLSLSLFLSFFFLALSLSILFFFARFLSLSSSLSLSLSLNPLLTIPSNF